MQVVAAFDSFKGSLTSLQAGEAAAAGVRETVPGARVRVVPVADGGEGLVDVLLAACGGQEVVVETVDPLGRVLRAAYGVLPDRTVVVEAARTLGPTLVDRVDPSLPLRASSYGLGLQLRAALDRGGPVLLGLGGTVTTDGGAGALLALGADLRVPDAPPPGPTGNPLAAATLPGVAHLPDLARLEVLVDVASPLLGPTGAARLFGPQKGADPDQVLLLESWLARWAERLAVAAGRSVADVVSAPGAGAAGGLGAALLACGARLVPGFTAVAARVGLDDALVGADLVLTGEGSLDAQSALGKGPVGVADLARARGVPVVALAGRVAHPLGDVGARFDAALGIHPAPLPAARALDPAVAAAHLRTAAGEVARLVDRSRGRPGQRLWTDERPGR